MQLVRFLVRHNPYNAGERAGFSDAFAEQLIRLKVAERALTNGGDSDTTLESKDDTEEMNGKGKRNRPKKKRVFNPPADKMVSEPGQAK